MTHNKVNLEEQMKFLVALQGLDTQILKIQRELETIPEEIGRQEEEFKEKSANLKKLEDELKALQLKRKEKEIDLEAKEGSIKKFQSQLYQIKTNKEYTALEQEIERTRADNSLIEENIIRILDQLDAQNQKIVKEKEVLKGEEVNLNQEKKRMSDEALALEKEVEGFKSQRSELAPKVDKNILSKYERILKNKDGLAVVPISNDACQGCFRVMPPQVINEVRMKAELILCENCSRILYCSET